jgi:uncharacterized protein with NRDE domain
MPPRERSELRETIRIDPIEIGTKPGAPLSSARQYYGTRLSTVLLVRRADRRVLFVERDVWVQDSAGGVCEAPHESQRVFRFAVQSPPANSTQL